MRQELDDMQEHLDQIGSGTRTDFGAIRDELYVTLATLNSTLQSTAEDLREEVATEMSRINEVEEEARRGKWPDGAFCFLANGACPAGFETMSGYMKAVSLYAGSAGYIKPATFGSSKIKCHGNCGQYGHWTGELYLVTCCK